MSVRRLLPVLICAALVGAACGEDPGGRSAVTADGTTTVSTATPTTSSTSSSTSTSTTTSTVAAPATGVGPAYAGPTPLTGLEGFGLYVVDVAPSGTLVGTNTRGCVGPDEWGSMTGCVSDVVVWDDRSAEPRVVLERATAIAIDSRERVLASSDDDTLVVVDLTTGVTVVVAPPAGSLGLTGSDLAGDLVVGAVVTGEGDDFSGPETEAMVYDLGAGTLTRLPGHRYAAAVNDAGTVTGFGPAFRWDAPTGVVTLPTLDAPDQYGPGEAWPTEIDTQGRISGTSTYSPLDTCHTDFPCRRVVVWDSTTGGITDLGTPASEHPSVEGANDAGLIVAMDGMDRAIPYVWDPLEALWVALPCPADQQQCTPTAIGADGTVYGYLRGADGTDVPVCWERSR